MKLHWLPLTLDDDYIRDAIALAKRYGGIEAFHLSHRLVHDADDIMHDSVRLQKVRDVTRLLQSEGFAVWSWTHEYLNPPSNCLVNGKLNLDHPELREHLENKYRTFFQELLPGLEGLVLTFAETQYEVYKPTNVISAFTGESAAAQRTKQLVDAMQGICEVNNAKLAIRDFVYRFDEITEMLDAIVGVDERVAVMSKCVPHDWHPYYPDNPVIGKVGEKEQWVEFDLGHEYEMQTVLPYAEPELLFRRIQAAHALGIQTFCLRLDRYDGKEGNSAIYQPWGQLELLVFSKCAQNPSMSLQEIVSDWEQEHFPGAWQVLGIATEIVRRMLFPEQLWLADHSNLPRFGYARDHIKGGNADRLPVWTLSPKDQMAEAYCDKPSKEWYQILLQENEKTSFYVGEIERLLEDNQIDLSNYPLWFDGLHALKSWDRLFQLYKKAYFGIRLYQNDKQAITIEQLQNDVDILEEACDLFREHFPELMLTGDAAWKFHPGVIASLREQLKRNETGRGEEDDRG
ncbi:hypothetical protein [Paenibacillus cremeus]|uniref:Uncharacterized protein n=1 Tax=Paenibacillus cremeus TaxID=2163881 RepID=A0A559K4V2_9BACL|nr:hypothetical protein [Paenibacillus cremeus]TVY07178.1 hypothetical protein FPZ49_25035 [Paenibacillus cremeus]